MDERINQLESLAALQDNTIAALNAEIVRQQHDIAALQRRIATLEQKMDQISQPNEIAGNERPPHW
jgi:uncharacterized coiled-coil protein SlyX